MGEAEQKWKIKNQKPKIGGSHLWEDCFLVVTAGPLTPFWILTCNFAF